MASFFGVRSHIFLLALHPWAYNTVNFVWVNFVW